ncbi:MAG: outer membrane beta-barrel protein [Ramlibacter sp.]
MATIRILLCLLFAAVTLHPRLAHAQLQPGADAGLSVEPSNSSRFPALGRSYVGINLGSSRRGPACSRLSLTCDGADRPMKLVAGRQVGSSWGVELGFVDLGRISRPTGESRAQGLNLSLVGKAPLGESFGVFGKIGPAWGRTESLAPGALAMGSDSGVGLSYSAGMSYAFSPRLSATLEWESNDFRFGGGAREPVRSTSLGLQYRY